MVNLNKLLMSVVLVATVAVKAEEVKKSEAATQKSEIYTELKKLYIDVTAQENIDNAKDCTNKVLEQVEKVFVQYPMYIPASFFFGRASMAARAAYGAKIRNMYTGSGLSAGHFYYNRTDKGVAAKDVENNQPQIALINSEA